MIEKKDAVVYATDLHLTDRQPANRVTPVSNCIKVFSNLMELARDNGGVLLLGGDLFDIPNPSFNLLVDVMKVLNFFSDVDVYICRGNHDLHYANLDNPSGVSVLVEAGLLRVLTMDDHVQSGFVVSALEYDPKLPLITVEHEGKKYFDFMTDTSGQRNLTTIGIVHLPIVTKPVPYDHILAQNILTDVDYLLCGHIHERFFKLIKSKNLYNEGTTKVINPGCLFRLKRNEKDIVPTAIVIERTGNVARHYYVPITGDENPEFLQDADETITFNQAIDDAKIEISDVESYIRKSKYEKVVQDEALNLIDQSKELK